MHLVSIKELVDTIDQEKKNHLNLGRGLAPCIASSSLELAVWTRSMSLSMPKTKVLTALTPGD
jgi:hypothetical protein